MSLTTQSIGLAGGLCHGCGGRVWRFFNSKWRCVFLPLPVLRERVGVRAFSQLRKSPLPNPLEYRERGSEVATLKSYTLCHDVFLLLAQFRREFRAEVAGLEDLAN